MPYSEDFEDVFAAIRAGVEAALGPTGRCHRLDDSQPAGRIKERLVQAISECKLCVADISDQSPNVMWEVGYAMALGKPTILISQGPDTMPFDLQDMLTIHYDRGQLVRTLTRPLDRVIQDTCANMDQAAEMKPAVPSVFDDLRKEVFELREFVTRFVEARETAPRAWREETPTRPQEPLHLRGAWTSPKDGSHYYADIVRGRLVVPYCFGGNDALTGVFFGWRKVGNFWFARFEWTNHLFAGYAVLREASAARLKGAWWSSELAGLQPAAALPGSGSGFEWHRAPDLVPPGWAVEFLEGLAARGLQQELLGG